MNARPPTQIPTILVPVINSIPYFETCTAQSKIFEKEKKAHLWDTTTAQGEISSIIVTEFGPMLDFFTHIQAAQVVVLSLMILQASRQIEG